MEFGLTRTSAKEFNRIGMGTMTPAEAASYLRSGEFPLRSFRDMLRAVYPGQDIQERLVAGFMEDQPKAAKPSVQRKVRNWLSGQNTPTSREDVFRIAFSLGLTEANTTQLLGYCTDYGIHYRDGHDAVYVWFLRRGRPYAEAKAFFATLPPVPVLSEEIPKYGDHLTRDLQYEFYRPATTEDLRQWYIRSLNKFGSLHLRAYGYFNAYLNLLICPTSAWGVPEEPAYSIETVMETYLTMNMRAGKKRSQYDLVQRLVRRDWPNSTALTNIRNRKEDVPRKLILLLYIITGNQLNNNQGYYMEYASPKEHLSDHWVVLNSILLDCGMPTLDPRNPTDWLVLFALAAEEDEPMSDRMAQTIEELFKSETA